MKYTITILIIGILLGFILAEYLLQPEPIIASKPVIINRVTARVDTIYKVIYKDRPIIVASADTMLGKWGLLHAKYYFPPNNYFDFKFEPNRNIFKPRWYQTRTFGFVAGVATSALIIGLTRK